MSNDDVLPEIKEILGAMIFGANRPLDVKEMRECLVDVSKSVGGETAAFAGVKESDVRAALEYLKADLERQKCGFTISEVAGGYRFQSSAACGKWLRHLLNSERPNRLSQPALETLAIIAYRQPVSKPEIEGVRGVNVDHIIKSLLEIQLIRIVGRSDLPGRPFLFGTTQTFLEHFGLKDLNDLRQMEPLLLRERERKRIEQKMATLSNQAPGTKSQEPASAPGVAAVAEPAAGGAPAAEDGTMSAPGTPQDIENKAAANDNLPAEENAEDGDEFEDDDDESDEDGDGDDDEDDEEA